MQGNHNENKKNTISNNHVGIDIGPSTAAIVSSEKAYLLRFTEEIVSYQKEIRVLQRKTDRQRKTEHNNRLIIMEMELANLGASMA